MDPLYGLDGGVSLDMVWFLTSVSQTGCIINFVRVYLKGIIYLFIYLKIRTMYRGENNRTRSPLLGSPSNYLIA